MFLTPPEAAAILRNAGARRVTVQDRQWRGLYAFFERAGRIEVWRLRPDARPENFARDVARELGNEEKRAA
jgi:hypothetical protein